MRVSIVIAVHNEREHLEKTIASCVAGCATLDHEIIVANDASNDLDETGLIKQFPGIRVSSSRERLGPSPTKDRGARIATGDILLFLDAHCAAEPGAISRLVEVVESGPEDAIIIPTVAALDTEIWKATQNRQGHGYVITLDTFHGQWVSLRQMKSVEIQGRALYESPSLMGCALAIRKTLYESLDGFDPDMRFWGIEDVDLALRCWMLGGQVLHDPQAIVGHRFQPSFLNYSAPREHIVANQMRMARKHLSEAAWKDWLQRCQARLAGLGADSEGLYEAAWALFSERRESVEEQRAYVLGSRVRDEFWYAERFGLSWPAKKSATSQQPELGGFPAAQRLMVAAFAPSPPPEPPRGASSVQTVTSTNYVPVTQFAVSQRMASYQLGTWVTQVSSISYALSRISLSARWGPSLAPSYGGAYQASKRSHSGGGRRYVAELSSNVLRQQPVTPPKKKAAANVMSTFSIQKPMPLSCSGTSFVCPGDDSKERIQEFDSQVRAMQAATRTWLEALISKTPGMSYEMQKGLREVFDMWRASGVSKSYPTWTAWSFQDWLKKSSRENPRRFKDHSNEVEFLNNHFGSNNQSSTSQGTSESPIGKCKQPLFSVSAGCVIDAVVSDVRWGVAPYDGQVLWDPTGDCRFISEGIVEDGQRYLEVYYIPSRGKRVWFDRGSISTAIA